MRFSAIAYTNHNGVMGDGNTQTIEILPPGRIGPNKRYKIQVAIDGKNFVDTPYVYMTLETEMVKELHDYHNYTKDDVKLAKVKYIDKDTKKEIAKTEEIKCYSYFKTLELLSEAKDISGYKLVKKPDMEKTYEEQPIVYYEYEKVSKEAILDAEIKNAVATEDEKVNVADIVVPNLEGSKIICDEVNGLKIDENGSLVGMPKDIVFEPGKNKSTIKLNVTVKNGDKTISKEVTITVTKKEDASISRPSSSSRRKKKYENSTVVTENEYKIDDIIISSDIDSTRNLVRLAGKDRTETSVKVSKSIYPKGADIVVISNKDKSSDSISATPYANLLKAPILYSNTSDVPDSIVNEIKRLKANKIVIVGGEQSITKSQEKQLKAMGIKIDRINGKDRYETSSMIADRMMKLLGTLDNIVIANGDSQVDAVSIAPIAIRQTSPILLTNGNNLSEGTDKIISSSKNVILAGGSQSISDNLEKFVRSKPLKNVERISGKDRYETAAEIARTFSGNSDICIYANGTKIEDALISAQLSGYKNAPIILVNDKNISESTKDYLKNNKIKKNIFVGGENSISDETVKTVHGLVKDNK